MIISQGERTGDSLLLRFLVFGFLFGICFPIMAIALDLFFKSISLSLQNIIYLHRVNPIHYIIDSAPIVLALVSFGIGRYVAVREKKIQESLKHELDNTQKIAKFSQDLILGNFDTKVEIDDKKTQDTFLQLKKSLESSVEKERITNWTNQGVALLMDLLKESEDGSQKFANSVISILVRYLEAFRGALYQVNYSKAEGEYLSLLAGYALENTNLKDRHWALGEGLIGEVAQSGKTSYLINTLKTDSAHQSNSDKQSLVVVPLVYQRRVRGVIEIITYNELRPYHIAFLERIADNIALKFDQGES